MRKNQRIVVVRECTQVLCGLRLSVTAGGSHSDACPRCGAPMREAASRRLHVESPIGWLDPLPCPFYVLLDNVRSAFNVGSIFRIADGLGVASVYACGITPTPDNAKVTKTALGSERSVPWSYHTNALVTAAELRATGVQLWALETVRGSSPLTDHSLPFSSTGVCLVVGNELAGVDPELMEICDRIVHIPMQGAKGSLNVAVAFGIAGYWLRGAALIRHMENVPCA